MDMGVELDMLIMPCIDDITDITDREEVLCAGGRGQPEDRRVPRLPHTAMLQRIHQTNVDNRSTKRGRGRARLLQKPVERTTHSPGSSQMSEPPILDPQPPQPYREPAVSYNGQWLEQDFPSLNTTGDDSESDRVSERQEVTNRITPDVKPATNIDTSIYRDTKSRRNNTTLADHLIPDEPVINQTNIHQTNTNLVDDLNKPDFIHPSHIVKPKKQTVNKFNFSQANQSMMQDFLAIQTTHGFKPKKVMSLTRSNLQRHVRDSGLFYDSNDNEDPVNMDNFVLDDLPIYQRYAVTHDDIERAKHNKVPQHVKDIVNDVGNTQPPILNSNTPVVEYDTFNQNGIASTRDSCLSNLSDRSVVDDDDLSLDQNNSCYYDDIRDIEDEVNLELDNERLDCEANLAVENQCNTDVDRLVPDKCSTEQNGSTCMKININPSVLRETLTELENDLRGTSHDKEEENVNSCQIERPCKSELKLVNTDPSENINKENKEKVQNNETCCVSGTESEKISNKGGVTDEELDAFASVGDNGDELDEFELDVGALKLSVTTKEEANSNTQPDDSNDGFQKVRSRHSSRKRSHSPDAKQAKASVRHTDNTIWRLYGKTVLQVDGLPLDVDISDLHSMVSGFGKVIDYQVRQIEQASAVRFKLCSEDACDFAVQCLHDTDCLFPDTNCVLICSKLEL